MNRAMERFRQMIGAVLDGNGEAPANVRRAAHAHAAALAGWPPVEAPELPEGLRSYVDKVAKHAYKTTDEDLEALRQVGYSEEAIFELTVTTALGAGVARFERGLAALEGKRR